jgi:hypothetical protein
MLEYKMSSGSGSGSGSGTFSAGYIDTAVNKTAFGNAFGHFRHDKNPKPILGANALFLFFGDFRNLFLRLNLISHQVYRAKKTKKKQQKQKNEKLT